MTKLDKLHLENKNLSISIVEAFSVLLNTKKTKYVEMGLNLFKNKFDKNISEKTNDDYEKKRYFIEQYGAPFENLKDLSPIKSHLLYHFIEYFIDGDEIKKLNKFIELNERQMIKNSDVTKYKDFEQVFNEVSIAELKLLENQMEKEIIKLHEDDEWLILKPLSWLSSKKYGSSTKWCTASEKNPEYFRRYSSEGILIYCLNKLTGKHTAVFKKLIDDFELSFWNVLDKRIDSLESNLPNFILEIVKEQIEKNITNYNLLSVEQKEVETNIIARWEMERELISHPEVEVPHAAPIISMEEALNRMRNIQ